MDARVSVVSALKQYYYTDCVFLVCATRKPHQESDTIPSPLQETTLLVNLQKAVQGIPTATLDLQTLEDVREENRCRRNRPLYVIPTFDNTTSRLLDKVLQQPRACYPRWLVFLDTASNLEASLRDVNIPFDCEFLVAQQGVRLSEVYRVSRTLPLQSFPWGSWSPGGGLQGPALGLYSRRHDLQGIQLKAVAIHNPTDVIVRNGIVRGFLIDIYDIIKHKLNFSIAVVVPVGEPIGRPDNNGSWNGIMGYLQRGDADIYLNPAVFNNLRLKTFTISQSLVIFRVLAYIREPQEADWSWSTYLTPFSGALWLAVLGSILVLSGVMYLMQQAGRRCGNGTEDKRFLCSFCDIVDYVAGIFCSQGYWCLPRSWSRRLVHWTSYLLSLTLWGAFSANLVAHLTMKPALDLPFTSFEGLLDDGTYQLTVLDGSIHKELFQISKEPVIRKIFSTFIKPNLNNLPTTFMQGLEGVCKEKMVLLASNVLVDSVRHLLSCRVVPLPDVQVYSSSVGLALRKGYSYNRIIMHSLEEMRGSGVLKDITRKNYFNQVPEIETPFVGITFGIAAPIFVVLAVTMSTAILIVMLQKLYLNYKEGN